jgi:diaminohydroxyphosphoribosylaminopyrimidine deaminase / 5-amino-6-(5-phosphoribosylamino)uracil reductase
MSMQRALELAERGRGTTHPNPVVGAVVVRGDDVVGEGWTEPPPGRHGEIVALDEAGRLARGATLYVTMEPCAHYGRTPPCVDRILEAGIRRVVAAAKDPSCDAGGGLERLREHGVAVELTDSFQARRQNEAWRTWVTLRRPFVILKAAVTLDGRATVPDSRWITGEVARRRVHELRAEVDAVAVGMGTVRADEPRLTARGVGTGRQPRRLAFGRGPLPRGSELELRTRGLRDELQALADEGVQSLLLEGGPTIAQSFLREDLVDKVLVFVAPRIGGGGLPFFPAESSATHKLTRLRAEPVGEDVLLTAYVHEP